ncbi:MAG: 30S ribosomal protein S12 methylthiotransferase RimO [Bacteroidota bacterium]|jgi:ribosomal protein S12 methylthiotransferase
MRTKYSRKRKVNVVTFGCSKNIVDSEVLMGQLKANRFDVSHESTSENQEIVIINTCGFIENAKQESIDAILQFANAKKDGVIEKLYVTGCLSERYKTELEKEIPEVDSYFGTRELPRLLKTLKADYKKELVGERFLTTPLHYAYFKISEGCDRPCSFCAIPLMRGGHKSVPEDELVLRAKKLAASGTKELLLIAQDLTYYGIDLHGKRTLPDLLRKLSDVEGIEWIRLHYAFPGGFPLEVLDVINERQNICNYIDMPLQHISNRILKSMRRGTTKEKTNQLIDKIRDKVPDIALRTTLISGYPGETDEEHEEVLSWIEKVRFDRLGVFTYSHEEDTHAFNLNDDVSEEVKLSRMSRIMETQQGISLELNQKKVGKILKVVIDRKENEFFVGRTEYDSPDVDNEVFINVDDKNYFSPGSFHRIKITDAGEFDLSGVPFK